MDKQLNAGEVLLQVQKENKCIKELAEYLYGYSIDTMEDCYYVAEKLYQLGYRKEEVI